MKGVLTGDARSINKFDCGDIIYNKTLLKKLF